MGRGPGPGPQQAPWAPVGGGNARHVPPNSDPRGSLPIGLSSSGPHPMPLGPLQLEGALEVEDQAQEQASRGPDCVGKTPMVLPLILQSRRAPPCPLLLLVPPPPRPGPMSFRGGLRG